jgi:hypothetical protein
MRSQLVSQVADKNFGDAKSIVGSEYARVAKPLSWRRGMVLKRIEENRDRRRLDVQVEMLKEEKSLRVSPPV